jgi:16S rRNA (adenine1518-N6/adenine1519-N6)-dimethyltransferase
MQKFDVQSLLQKLAELDVRPNKKLGQNFLINKDVCERIVAEAFKKTPTHVVEVGPGLGALTEFVLEKNIPTTLIELDRTFADYWKDRPATMVQADALQIDWKTLNFPEGTLLLSNLPYQISSSLVIERCIDPAGITRMVLMFQKEVGQRLLAQHDSDDYGLLTVMAQAFWKVTHLTDVGSKDFYPPPQIASRVLVFDWKNTSISNPAKFLTYAKVAFSQRRKFLAKNLSQQFEKSKILEKFASLGISEKARAEDLTVHQFIELFESLR